MQKGGGNVIEVACWARARRSFFEGKETVGGRATQMLDFVPPLNAAEDEARSIGWCQA